MPPMIIRSSTDYIIAGVANKRKNSSNATLANDASMTVWTPTATYRIQLHGLTFHSVNAGRVTILLGTDELFDSVVPAGYVGIITFPPFGVEAAALNNALTLVNHTGDANDVSCCAWGREVKA